MPSAHVKFFADKPDTFLTEILLKLKPAFYQADEKVFDRGENSTFMIFILSGSMAIIDHETGQPLNVMGANDVLGEVGVLLNQVLLQPLSLPLFSLSLSLSLSLCLP